MFGEDGELAEAFPPALAVGVALPIDGDADLVEEVAVAAGEVELQAHKAAVLDFRPRHPGGGVVFRRVAGARRKHLAGNRPHMRCAVEGTFRHDNLRAPRRADVGEVVSAADGRAVGVLGGARVGLAARIDGRLDDDLVRAGIEGKEIAVDGEAAVGAASEDGAFAGPPLPDGGARVLGGVVAAGGEAFHAVFPQRGEVPRAPRGGPRGHLDAIDALRRAHADGLLHVVLQVRRHPDEWEGAQCPHGATGGKEGAGEDGDAFHSTSR